MRVAKARKSAREIRRGQTPQSPASVMCRYGLRAKLPRLQLGSNRSAWEIPDPRNMDEAILVEQWEGYRPSCGTNHMLDELHRLKRCSASCTR